MFKLRIKYEKTGLIRFVSHLEMLRLFERSLRRMGVPLSFTQGFNPHPKISFALPLSVGVESVAELVDVELDTEVSPETFIALSKEHMPTGIQVVKAQYITEKASLMSLVSWSGYYLTLSELPEGALENAVQGVLKETEISVMKKSKRGDEKAVNIRPLIQGLKAGRHSEGPTLSVIVASGSAGSVKPEWVVDALRAQGLPEVIIQRTLRTELYKDSDRGIAPIME